MGLFDGFNPNMGWLSAVLGQQQQNQLPADLMNPQIYGNVGGANSISNILSSILPPLNGGQQQSPFLPQQAQQPQQPGTPPPLDAPISVGPQRFGPGPSASMAPPTFPPQAANAMAQAQQPQAQPSASMAQAQPGIGQSIGNALQRIGGGIQDFGMGFSPGLSLPQYGQVGTDIAGNPQYGWVDRVHQTINGQPSGSGAGGSPFGGSLGFPRDASGQPLQGQELLAHLKKTDPTAASMVESIIRGDATAGGRNLQKYLPIATLVDPTLQQFNYGARSKTALDFSAGGASGRNVKSLETVGGHLDKMIDAFGNLDNTWSPEFNKAANWISQKRGQGNVNAFETYANGVSNELGTVFRAVGMSDAEVKSWRDQISNSASPDQFRASMTSLMDMLRTRKEALAKQYQEGTGRELPAGTFSKLDTAMSRMEEKLKLPTGNAPGGAMPGSQAQGVTKGGVKWSVQ